MVEEKIDIRNIFVVKPSIVAYDNTTYSFDKIMGKYLRCSRPISKLESFKLKKEGLDIPHTSLSNNINYKLQKNRYDKAKKENINNVEHTIILERNNIDFSIAISNSICLAKELITDDNIYKGIGNHTCEGEKYVNVKNDDMMSLMEYFLNNDKIDEWINEGYIFSIKSKYTIRELYSILFILKKEAELFYKNKMETIVVKKKRKEPIFVKCI